MKKQRFNSGWNVEEGIRDVFASMMYRSDPKAVTLPHDAMISEARSADCPNANQTGYYPSKTYTYTKRFHAPMEWEKQQVLLEFEGVMSKAMVYINEEYVARHTYGYSQFYVDVKPYLNLGQENEIKVVSINNDKCSRWYNGSGIYRDVNLYLGGSVSIVPEKMRITTQDIGDDYAVLTVDTKIINADSKKYDGRLKVDVLDAEGKIVAQESNKITIRGGQDADIHMRIVVSKPMLWNVDTPYLYTCKAYLTLDNIVLDVAEETFGIRQLKLDARKGLQINGESVKLRGACIHHDNGVIGACTLEAAEEFRAKKLKDAGFNSIRSAHHPMSKAMLRVCDRLGILVMDELIDMWNIPKNINDAAMDFPEMRQDEIRRMVDKDYNHPCVVLYSVGNELPEIGRADGRIQCREVANSLRENDATRYVTSGFNGFLALAGVSREEGLQMAQMFAPKGTDDPAELVSKMKEISAPPQSNNSSDGSEQLNDVMGDIPFEVRDMLHSSDIMTRQIEEVGDGLDVIGLNYMPVRHELEHELHPNHVIVGSESYPTEIVSLWKIVEQNPHVIGDFTWTGYDYLGEAGIGIYHYDVLTDGQGIYPDRVAYCGDINLNGYRRPISYLREIVYGLRKEPFISIERVNRYGYGCLRNHWKYDDALDSWTYPGYEGKPARLKVLSPSEEVELFINGRSLGRQKTGKEHEFSATYELTYEPGELVAVAYDGEQEVSKTVLKTAGKVEQIQYNSSKSRLIADGQDAIILDIYLTDAYGILNMWEKHDVNIEVEGAAVLLGFGNANPSSENSYQATCCETYDGRVIAVIRSNGLTGETSVTISVDGIPDQNIIFKAE